MPKVYSFRKHKRLRKSNTSKTLNTTNALAELHQRRDVYEHVMSQTAKLLFETTELQRDPMYHFIFPSEKDLHSFASTRRIYFAPDLMNMLQSPTPPTLEDLKKLPQLPSGTKVWAVYLLVLEREGEKPEVYIGCGTETIYGVRTRFRQYDNESTLPKEVKDRIRNHDYKITFQGLLSWTPLPMNDELLHFKTRILYVTLEATLSILLWAMVSCDQDTYAMPVLCSWDVRSLPYKGCCTHVSFSKSVLGEEEVFTQEQLQPVKAIRERLSDERKVIREENRKKSGKKAASAKKTRTKALETVRFGCCVCGYSGKDRYGLRTHIQATKHCTTLDTLASSLAHHASVGEGVHGSNARQVLVTFAGFPVSVDQPFHKSEVYSKLVELVGLVVEQAGRGVDKGHGQAEDRLGRLVECGKSMPTPVGAEEDNSRSKQSAKNKHARESGRFACVPCGQAFAAKHQLETHVKGRPHLTGKPHFKKKYGQKMGELAKIVGLEAV